VANFKKYFRLRSYIEKLQWSRFFRDVVNSKYGKNLKIHCSSKIIDSILKDNVQLGRNVSIENCSIGSDCKILSDNYFYNATIDDYSYVNTHSFILRANIGKFCSIASHVYIGPGSHPMDFVSTHPFSFLKDFGGIISIDNAKIVTQREKKSIIIGNDVWIGQGTIIMENITIGDGAIIGAHTVVTKNVDPYAIVVGNPGKVIRYRFNKETIEELLKIKWWDWSKERLSENINGFYNPKVFIQKNKI
jgi:phosphonate metabolism protein (transferase hexapeptide repeat family)